MHTKPVTPRIHGILDYAFATVQLAAPAAIGLNSTAAKTYSVLGTGFLAVNALTATPVGIKDVLSFKDHQKADLGFLAGLSLLSFVPFLRKDKKALAFHLGFLALAIGHYLLTDYNAKARL